MKIFKSLLIILLLLVLTGCSNNVDYQSSLEGEWLESVSTPSGDKVLTDNLIITPNGMYTSCLQVIDKSSGEDKDLGAQTAVGSYELSGDKLTLTPETISGSIELPEDLPQDEMLGASSIGATTYTITIEDNTLTMTPQNSQYQLTFEKGTIE